MKQVSCPQCGKLRVAKSGGVLCRACYLASRAPCLVCACGATKTAKSATCWACYCRGEEASRQARKNRSATCSCGAKKHRQSRTCMECRRGPNRAAKICACGRLKSKPSAVRCRVCRAVQAADFRTDIMRHFRPERLRALMDRYGFSVRALAEASGEPARTITDWLGVRQCKPTRASLTRVMESLGLIQCHACAGTGAVRDAEVEALMEFVEERGDVAKFGPIQGTVKAVAPKAPTGPKKPHHWGAEKAKDYRARVKARPAEEAAREAVAS